MKSWTFKSNHNSKICEHTFTFNQRFKQPFLWKLIHDHELTLDKLSFQKICDEFEEFIEAEHKLNLLGENLIEHYEPINIGFELLTKFEEVFE